MGVCRHHLNVTRDWLNDVLFRFCNQSLCSNLYVTITDVSFDS